MIYVTHDQVEAMTLADRIAVLSDGMLMQCDTPQKLYERPVNRFVAQFIGSPKMNLITAEGNDESSVTLDGGNTRIHVPGGYSGTVVAAGRAFDGRGAARGRR